MNRRELLLHEMGITLWELTRPDVLQGIGNIQLSSQIHTLLLTNQPHLLQQPLVQDLLRAANSTTNNTLLTLSSDKLARVESQQPLLIFYTEDCQTALANSPFAKPPHQVIALPKHLQLDAVQKRQIWQQIQQYLIQYDEH
ncbi:DNA polymerase III subunit psi [Gallibacterium sp. AGMB14963]|uniref:DNA polymerase III subunit psi n=1 Tax=Gallibacterium faecale TaxID=3019086 RepID=UPI0022F193B3|nr:DNA polymerase III subunit psi [Gallibacterium sp. AGMB14963]MDA3977793.1 DNA polymerase III subunit psi [Gallibacterium sp. AGMB14963]